MDIYSTDKYIFFIRHGRDDDRYRGGWSKRSLVEEGRLQAESLAVEFCKHKREMNINTVITSDLPRAVQTATPVCDALGIKPVYKFCWRETNNGKLAGMANKDAEVLYPGLYWNSLGYNEKYPGGESPIDFFHRIRHAFYKLRADAVDGNIESNTAVFTHCGVINIVYCIVNNKKWTNKKRYLSIPFTGVYAYNVTKNTLSRYVL